uniref:Uncharacterized protein n=1 Tax=Cacopsylla melanoneura TaxID=428564 RepID=A0A8D9BEI7_9HEMI
MIWSANHFLRVFDWYLCIMSMFEGLAQTQSSIYPDKFLLHYTKNVEWGYIADQNCKQNSYKDENKNTNQHKALPIPIPIAIAVKTADILKSRQIEQRFIFR